MEYPKAIMRKSELIKIGFPEKWLDTVYLRYGQKAAWKMGNSRNSPLVFDTTELEKIRRSQCAGGRAFSF